MEVGAGGGLGVLPRDEKVGDTEAALAGVAMNPSEDGGEAEYLPGFKDDALAPRGPVAFDVRHQLGKAADALGWLIGLSRLVRKLGIVEVRPGWICGCAIEIGEVALAGKAMPFAGRYAASDDGSRVVSRLVGEAHTLFHSSGPMTI